MRTSPSSKLSRPPAGAIEIIRGDGSRPSTSASGIRLGNLGGDPAVSAADVEQTADSVDLEPFEGTASEPLLQVADPAILGPVPVRHGYILLRVLEPSRA